MATSNLSRATVIIWQRQVLPQTRWFIRDQKVVSVLVDRV
jgi:hypothetical protein